MSWFYKWPYSHGASVSFMSQHTAWSTSSSHAYGWQPCHIHMPSVLKRGSLNFLEPLGPVQACRGTALPYFLFATGWDSSSYYHVQPTGGVLKTSWRMGTGDSLLGVSTSWHMASPQFKSRNEKGPSTVLYLNWFIITLYLHCNNNKTKSIQVHINGCKWHHKIPWQ